MKTKEQLIKELECLKQENIRLKEANKHLENSESLEKENVLQYQKIFNCAHEAIIHFNKLGIVKAVNPAFTKLTGIPAEEVLNKNAVALVNKFVNLKDIPTMLKQVSSFLSGGTVGTYELEYQNKILQICSPSEKAKFGYTTVIRDITEQKKSQMDIQQANQLLETIFNNTHTLMAYLDADFNFIRVNKSYAMSDDKEPNFFVGKNLFDLYPDNEDKLIFQKVVKTGKAYFSTAKSFQYLYSPNKEKAYWDWSLIPIKDKNGNVLEILLTLLNVTDRVVAEQELMEREARLRSIFNAAENISFIITDMNGVNAKVLEFSPGAENIFGYQREEIINKPVAVLHLPKDVKKFPGAHQKMKKNKVGFSGESTLVRKSGEQFPALFTTYPIFDPDGKVRSALGVSIDISARKKIERALKENEERLRTLINATPDIVCFKDGQGRWLEANQADLKLFQLTNVDYKGKKDSELAEYSSFYHDAFLTCEDSDEMTWKARKATRGEEIIPRPNAPSKVYDVIKVPLFNPDGNRRGLVVLGRDITERKQAEQKLKIEKQRLDFALQATEDGLWDWNLKTGKVYFSPTYYTMLGYQVNEFPQSYESWKNLVHPKDIGKAEQKINDHIEKRSPIFEVEFRLKTKLGHWKWILGRGKIIERDAEDNPLRMVGTHVDISQRKQIEEHMKNRLLFLTQSVTDITAKPSFSDLFNVSEIQKIQDAFAEATGVASIITNPDGVPITKPSNFCRLCRDIIRKTEKGLKNCFHSDAVLGNPKHDGPKIQPCLSGGLWDSGASISAGEHHIANWLIGQVRNEQQHKKKMLEYAREIGADENEFKEALKEVTTMSLGQFEKVSQALFLMANQLSQMAFQNMQQARIINDLEIAEEEIRVLNSDLEERVKLRTSELENANKELNSFAYIVSHDLKAPLRGIHNLATWLVTDYSQKFDDDGREMFHLLKGRVLRMENLINGILTYSRAGRITRKETEVDLNNLIKNTIDIIDPGNNIQFIIETDLPKITGDAIQFEQIFQNLLGNAVKFMDKSTGLIKINCINEGEYWKFTISDNGPGIDEKYHKKIFQIFQTLQPRDELESTGIGLALVKKIVELYGGSIGLKSKLGKGCTFYFTLPKETYNRVK